MRRVQRGSWGAVGVGAPWGLEHARRLAAAASVATLACSAALLGGCGTSRNHGEIHFADGLESLALGDSSEALALFERANYELGGDARVLLQIARLQAADGSPEGRARARATLAQAQRHDADGSATRVLLGELLRAQRYYRASAAALAEALRLDPAQPRAWLLLGHSVLEQYLADMEVPAFLDSARFCYQRAYDLDSTLAEARYRVAFLHLHQGRHEAARKMALAAVPHECPGRWGLLLVAIDYHLRRFVEAQQWLDASFACMTVAEREAWLGLAPLLHPDSVGAYKVRSEAGRDSLLQAYWWDQDPTPASLGNERVIEHVCRAVEADFYFALPWRVRPGRHSDRGEIYLRYGPPAVVWRNTMSRFPIWEWRYRTDGDYDTVFRFVDAMLNGDYIRVRRGPSLPYVQPAQTSLVFHDPPGGWRHVVRQFRGDQGRTALEIAYEFDVQDDMVGLNVEAAAWRGPGDLARRLRTSVQSGSLYRNADRRIGRLRFEVRPGVSSLGLELAGLERRALGAGSDSTTTGLWVVWRARAKDTLEIQRYDAEQIAMSDLMLAHEVHGGTGGLFDMGGVIAVPRADDRITQPTLQLYFEVYAPARSVREQTAVAVRYAVRALPPRRWSFWDQMRPDYLERLDPRRRPVVEATFTFLPQADLERQQLGIDLGALEPGPYELHVELVDTATSTTTSRRAEFDYAPVPAIATGPAPAP